MSGPLRSPNSNWAGGPSERQRSYASQLQEQDALIYAYEHLTGMPNAGEALTRLRKIGSMVKPIMRKRGWKVHVLTEFLPEDQRLLGLNIDRGYKICVRLRYNHPHGSFLPIEQCIDTMLHELSHIVFGPHDAKFNALWDQLRDEHETLLFKGYTGEGFLSKGQRLGGGRIPPPSEVHRLARQSAGERHSIIKAAGRKLGGKGVRPGQDPRQAIVGAVEARNTISRGCASGTEGADRLATQASNSATTTKSEVDDANDRAIAEALFELWWEEEMKKLNDPYTVPPTGAGLTWSREGGLSSYTEPPPAPTTKSHVKWPGKRPWSDISEEQQMAWAMQESLSGASVTLPTTTASGPDADSDPPIHTDTRQENPWHVPNNVVPGPSRSALNNRTDIALALSAAMPPAGSDENLPGPIVLDSDGEDRDGANVLSSPSEANKPAIADQQPAAQPEQQTTTAPASAPVPSRPTSVRSTKSTTTAPVTPTSEPDTWPCEICTCLNPFQYLACDACGVERPSKVNARTAARSLEKVERDALKAGIKKPESLGWNCRRCGTFMEHKYWTCSACGLMKSDSRASEHAL